MQYHPVAHKVIQKFIF